MKTTLTFKRNLRTIPKEAVLCLVAAASARFGWPFPAGARAAGARVCYLYLRQNDVIYLLYVFTKGDADNLSAEGKKAMRNLAQHIRNE